MMPVTSLYEDIRRRALRTFITGAVFLCALLMYPIPTVLLGVFILLWYGGYEVILAGLLLDALLAPHTTIFGDFYYTALFLVLSGVSVLIRKRFVYSKRLL